MGVPERPEHAEMTDYGTPSEPMQQRYALKTRPPTRLKLRILAPLPDQCNKDTRSKLVLQPD